MVIRCIRFLTILSLALFGACKKEGLIVDDFDVDSPEYQAGVRIALMKAEQMTGILWTPLGNIPKTRPEGTFFEPGECIKGAPYSSVKELNKFLGQDVSFHTFLSAVSNPRSVLYTENVSQPPYHGINCGPYYGTVCSMSVNYALGIDAPYPSRSYANAPFMKKISDCDVDQIRVCDVLASYGHTIMVVDYEADETGKIRKVKFLENGSYVVFDRESLIDYWVTGGFVLYRYKKMADNLFCPDIEPAEVLPSICVQRGDKAIYKEGELVVLNILDDSYTTIELYRDESIFERREIAFLDETFPGLQEGMYKARLVGKNGKMSSFTFFEVRRCSIKVNVQKERISIDFGNTSIPPTAVELCELSGEHLYTDLINENERLDGRKYVPKLSIEEPYYCKVFFQGQYGKIISDYIRIN